MLLLLLSFPYYYHYYIPRFLSGWKEESKAKQTVNGKKVKTHSTSTSVRNVKTIFSFVFVNMIYQTVTDEKENERERRMLKI